MDKNSQPKRWALITGASAGIGAAFAHELAMRGISLVLTARRLARIETLARELHDKHGVEAHSITGDLADPSTPRKLVDEIANRGIPIDILINNAGYGVSGRFESQTWTTHADFLQVMVTAPCELVHKLLPGMQQRGYGRVINIASLAGIMPGSAGHTLYGASKAFLIKFSQSLALENTTRGVNVCALCPGFTYSEFHDITGTRGIVSKMPKWMWLSSAEVARIGVDAVERGEIVCVTGRVNRVIKSMIKIMPDKFALKMVQKRSKSFRKQE
jgi:uncharacterized protein